MPLPLTLRLLGNKKNRYIVLIYLLYLKPRSFLLLLCQIITRMIITRILTLYYG